MTPNFDQVLSQARALPLSDRIKLKELLAQETARDAAEERRDLVMQMMGSMAGLLPTSEQFLAEKHADLVVEEGQ